MITSCITTSRRYKLSSEVGAAVEGCLAWKNVLYKREVNFLRSCEHIPRPSPGAFKKDQFNSDGTGDTMVLLLKFALAASAIIGLVPSLAAAVTGRQTWVPGTQNNTREFYLSMVVTNGYITYEGRTSER